MMLEKILADNLRELEAKKKALSLADVKRMALESAPPLDFALALRGDGIRLIAEVKKASPSRGVIRPDFNPVEIARVYADNGAAAISVLTEPRYFKGSINYLEDVRKALGDKKLPLLRKDFISDPYQVYESRTYGADSLLLIVAILTGEKLRELLRLSHELGMKCLVEVHSEAEVEVALESGAEIIGINNRNLETFEVNLAVTERLRLLIPPDKILVSESGIKNRSDMERMVRLNVDAVLVGEALTSAPDIAARMKELL